MSIKVAIRICLGMNGVIYLSSHNCMGIKIDIIVPYPL